MRRRNVSLLVAVILAAALAAGCSPESGRVRGGGAGADLGNRHLGPGMEIHGQVNPLYQTPIDSQAVVVENKATPVAK